MGNKKKGEITLIPKDKLEQLTKAKGTEEQTKERFEKFRIAYISNSVHKTLLQDMKKNKVRKATEIPQEVLDQNVWEIFSKAEVLHEPAGKGIDPKHVEWVLKKHGHDPRMIRKAIEAQDYMKVNGKWKARKRFKRKKGSYTLMRR